MPAYPARAGMLRGPSPQRVWGARRRPPRPGNLCTAPAAHAGRARRGGCTRRTTPWAVHDETTASGPRPLPHPTTSTDRGRRGGRSSVRLLERRDGARPRGASGRGRAVGALRRRGRRRSPGCGRRFVDELPPLAAHGVSSTLGDLESVVGVVGVVGVELDHLGAELVGEQSGRDFVVELTAAVAVRPGQGQQALQGQHRCQGRCPCCPCSPQGGGSGRRSRRTPRRCSPCGRHRRFARPST